MIEVNITEEMKKEARQKAEQLGKLRNSITQGDGNVAGYIGELIAQQVMKGELKETFDYDLVLEDGKKIDVKTKRTSVKPKDYYECSVAAFNTKQRCDGYAFVRVQNDLSKGWFLGHLSKDKYFNMAKHLKKGEVDPSNNFVVKADCYNVKISDLEIGA